MRLSARDLLAEMVAARPFGISGAHVLGVFRAHGIEQMKGPDRVWKLHRAMAHVHEHCESEPIYAAAYALGAICMIHPAPRLNGRTALAIAHVIMRAGTGDTTLDPRSALLMPPQARQNTPQWRRAPQEEFSLDRIGERQSLPRLERWLTMPRPTRAERILASRLSGAHCPGTCTCQICNRWRDAGLAETEAIAEWEARLAARKARQTAVSWGV